MLICAVQARLFLKAHLNPRVIAVVCFYFESLYWLNAWSEWLNALKLFEKADIMIIMVSNHISCVILVMATVASLRFTQVEIQDPLSAKGKIYDPMILWWGLYSHIWIMEGRCLYVDNYYTSPTLFNDTLGPVERPGIGKEFPIHFEQLRWKIRVTNLSWTIELCWK